MNTKEKKITNNQNTKPNPRIPHHKQGLTFDCKHCGKENTQYHPKHVYCSEPATCMWDHKGIAHEPRECSGCHCIDDVPSQGKGYVCRICKMFKQNSTRTDVTRRTPS